MTTAAMMRASTATNAPATDMIGDALLAGEVLVAVVVGGVVLVRRCSAGSCSGRRCSAGRWCGRRCSYIGNCCIVMHKVTIKL